MYIMCHSGAFGKVFYGQLKDEADDSNLEVAVKTMKGTSHQVNRV